jgi:hypothetical protein
MNYILYSPFKSHRIVAAYQGELLTVPGVVRADHQHAVLGDVAIRLHGMSPGQMERSRADLC